MEHQVSPVSAEGMRENVDSRYLSFKLRRSRAFSLGHWLGGLSIGALLGVSINIGLLVVEGGDALKSLVPVDLAALGTPIAILAGALIVGYFQVRQTRLISNRALDRHIVQARQEAIEGLEWARKEREKLGMPEQAVLGGDLQVEIRSDLQSGREHLRR